MGEDQPENDSEPQNPFGRKLLEPQQCVPRPLSDCSTST